MSAATSATESAVHVLMRRALSLGAANAFDYATQFLLPVLLVRCITPDDFGHYRLLWLAAGTVIGVATLAMPTSLFYFLPRADAAGRRLYVKQTFVFLTATGLLAAWVLSPWNPWLPAQMEPLSARGAVVPAFVVLWIVTSLLDVLPAVDERIAWQAAARTGLAALRFTALAFAALLTRELDPVLWALLAFVVIKLALLLFYVARQHGLRGPLLRRQAFGDQLRYAAPFGVSGALYEWRVQADQWVAAALFPIATFASVSIAALLAPLLNLFRVSVCEAFLPSLSRLHAAQDNAGLVALNSRANVTVGALVYPLLAFVFVFAEDIVILLYTPSFLDAAGPLRVYSIGLAALVIETATLTLVMREGAFMLRLNVLALVVAIPISWLAAHEFGSAGAAAGGVVATFLDRFVTLRRVARRTGIALRSLQDWRTLARLLACAALAGALAWGVGALHWEGAHPLARLAGGGVLMAAAYCTLTATLGVGRGWMDALAALWRRVRTEP